MHQKGTTSVDRGDPCIVKIRRDLGIGSELKVFVDARLESEGYTHMLLGVSRCHRDKRVGECVCSVSIQFKQVGVLSPRKSCISRK